MSHTTLAAIRAPLCLAALLLVACGGDRAGTADTAAARDTAAAGGPSRIATVSGFQTPESALWDSAGGVWLISNINGNPGDKDNNGFISRVRADGTLDSLRFIAGGANLPLHAPKGMAIRGNELWVADIDVVHVFDRTTGAHTAHVDLAPTGATFLNDIAVGPDGSIYITDTAVRFTASGMEHPAPDRIFRIDPATRRATVAFEGDTLQRPNGIGWHSGSSSFVVVSFGGRSIMHWAPGDSLPTTIATGGGQFDGVVLTGDGRILVSSWADSSVSMVDGNALTPVVRGVAAPADIGFDRATNRLAIPLFNDNRVEIWDIGAR